MNKKKKHCLSCRFLKLKDCSYGVCKIDRGVIEPQNYPVKKHDALCDQWKDCGQNYYIRIGWIAAQSKIKPQ